MSYRVAGKLVAIVAMMAILSSCFVLKQEETFAVGTESNRLNLVIYVDWTKALNDYRIDRGTALTRDVVLAAAPDSLALTDEQLLVVCVFGGAALCAAGYLVPGILLSWFKDDVRHRSDFGPDLSAAANQSDCFAWTALPGRNFTTKPPGNSGCR